MTSKNKTKALVKQVQELEEHPGYELNSSYKTNKHVIVTFSKEHDIQLGDVLGGIIASEDLDDAIVQQIIVDGADHAVKHYTVIFVTPIEI